MNILLIEEEPKVADFISKGLKEQLYNVDIAYDGLFGEKLVLENDYDLMILDLVLPGISGLELCRRIREYKADLPILIISDLGNTQDKVAGLESGADDYLVKPFHFDELLARLKALSRRRLLIFPSIIHIAADLEVDSYKRTARIAGKEISLTNREFSLLELLIVNKNSVLSRAYIAKTIWGVNYKGGLSMINVYINSLRSKIDKAARPSLIHTVIGIGYVLKEE